MITSSVLRAVATSTGAELRQGSWGTCLVGHNLGTAALTAVLRQLWARPHTRGVKPEVVDRSVVLTLLPRLTWRRLDIDDRVLAREWRFLVGPEMGIKHLEPGEVPYEAVAEEALRHRILTVTLVRAQTEEAGYLWSTGNSLWAAGPEALNPEWDWSPGMDARARVAVCLALEESPSTLEAWP